MSQNTSILDKALNILSHPIDATKFIFVSIASSVIGVSIYEKYLSINFMIFFGFSLFVAYVYYIYCFFKNKIYERTIVPFLLIVYSFIIFVLILVARFNYGLDYGVSSRYTTDTQYGIIGLLWMSATMSTNRSLSRWNVKKIINLMLVAVVFIAYLFTNIIEWKTSPYRKIYFENLQQIALNYSNSSNDELSLFQNPNIEAVINGFRLLEKNHLNIFSENNKENFFNEYLTPKSGWYEEENGVRWTKKEFEFLVGRDSITTFSEATISGYIPPEQNNVKMSILIDGQLTLEQAMDEGSFSIKLPLKPNVESNSIKIKLNSSFTPQKSGINNDIRELRGIGYKYNTSIVFKRSILNENIYCYYNVPFRRLSS
ncbi:hypothetical protein Q0F98_12410 [Paenibacillus amylolyticus]|nr:hypothetical protein Q0F98_12410 [Paenibacillus amylolyticus]